MCITSVVSICVIDFWVFIAKITFLNQNDRNNHSINAQDTSHNDWDDRFHYEVRLDDTHATDTNATFSCSISRSQIFLLIITRLLAKINAQATPKYPKKYPVPVVVSADNPKTIFCNIKIYNIGLILKQKIIIVIIITKWLTRSFRSREIRKFWN
jgi:hypothetical protein